MSCKASLYIAVMVCFHNPSLLCPALSWLQYYLAKTSERSFWCEEHDRASPKIPQGMQFSVLQIKAVSLEERCYISLHAATMVYTYLLTTIKSYIPCIHGGWLARGLLYSYWSIEKIKAGRELNSHQHRYLEQHATIHMYIIYYKVLIGRHLVIQQVSPII